MPRRRTHRPVRSGRKQPPLARWSRAAASDASGLRCRRHRCWKRLTLGGPANSRWPRHRPGPPPRRRWTPAGSRRGRCLRTWCRPPKPISPSPAKPRHCSHWNSARSSDSLAFGAISWSTNPPEGGLEHLLLFGQYQVRHWCSLHPNDLTAAVAPESGPKRRLSLPAPRKPSGTPRRPPQECSSSRRTPGWRAPCFQWYRQSGPFAPTGPRTP